MTQRLLAGSCTDCGTVGCGSATTGKMLVRIRLVKYIAIFLRNVWETGLPAAVSQWVR
jgi:hypothetical protein